VPTVTVVTDVFLELGKEVAAALGSPGIGTSVIARPLGELKPQEVRKRARRASPGIVSALFASKMSGSTVGAVELPRILELPGQETEVNEYFYAQGWTDGLPIVLPREESVEKLVAAAKTSAQTTIGIIPPAMGIATIEKIAINAVMTGCEPRAFPVVLAAVRGCAAPSSTSFPCRLRPIRLRRSLSSTVRQ
jgi:hypothetical protein